MIQKYIKGKSEEQIENILIGLSNNELIEKCIIHQIFQFLPRDEYGKCVYNGNLTITHNNNVEKLPDNLTVNGTLFCSFNKLSELPINLTVTEDMFCILQKSFIKLKKIKSTIVKGKFYN